jgi:hypothetical protein
MMAPLVIAPRFCGPPDSGNGGYVCGLIAARLGGQAQITLRAPPPLATPMTVERGAEGSVRVRHGRTLVAEGTWLPASLEIEVPDPVPVGEARAAGARSRLRTHPEEHPFPSCFVCGPHRQPGDGLRILVGPVTGQDLSADVWYPDESLAGPDGYLRPEFVWAALDCAGAIGAIGEAAGAPAYLLGRFSVRQTGPVKTGEPHVVAGWRLGEDGRKLLAGSALFTAAGQVAGLARATWIRPR